MDNLRRSLLPITTFIRIDVRRLFRDKVAIFFIFIFPLIFLFIFGSIFSSDNEVSFRVGLLNQSDTAFAKDFEKQIKENKIFKVDPNITNREAAQEKMSRGQLDAAIILPNGFGGIMPGKSYPSGKAEIIYAEGNQSAGQTLASVLDGVFKQINQQFAPSEAPFTVSAQSTGQAGLTQFDYTFSGILGFTLLSLGIFGPTSVFPRLKQRGVLRRYQMTPIKVWQYFVANVVSNAIVGLLALVLMFSTAVAFFDLQMRGSYLVLASIIVLGTVMLFGIGLALGGWAKNENQAAPMAQLVSLPMMFLSGVFFPTFLMPELLQRITQFIPLTAVVDAVRLTITENAQFMELGPQFGIMFGWTIIIYIVAFRVFRWE